MTPPREPPAPAGTARPGAQRPEQLIRVLIVDDSATARAVFKSLLAGDPKIAIMGMAQDPFEAAEVMRRDLPDVILLDLELPRMDGLTFLGKIMAQRPIPVVICSAHTAAGSAATMRALEMGAAEVIGKPSLATDSDRQEAQILICDAIRAAAQTRRGRPVRRAAPLLQPGPKLTADEILPPARPGAGRVPRTPPLVAIGASTGGTEALTLILRALPPGAPPVVVVQHMPERFTAAFAQRLDGICRVAVREAADGDELHPGLALIAPGNRHLLLQRNGSAYRGAVVEGPYVSRHRPSVDVLFRSVAQAAGGNALGIILTGMGDDGAAGMAEMHAAGARTLAQDEASCVVYGMPREAVRAGGVDRSLPLEAMAREIAAWGEARAARR